MEATWFVLMKKKVLWYNFY